MSNYDDRKPASDAPGMRGRPPKPELGPGKQSFTAPPLHGRAGSPAPGPGNQTLRSRCHEQA